MHPERAARLLAVFGGILLLFVLLLRGLSLSATSNEDQVSGNGSMESLPVQRDFTISEDGQYITFQQGLSPIDSLDEDVTQGNWYRMALEGGPVISSEPPPKPDIKPFLLRNRQLFLLVGEGASLAPGSLPETQVTKTALAPDGKSIAFAAVSPNGSQRLYILYSSGKLEWFGEEESIKGLSWSPNGENLTYIAPRDGADQILRIDRSGNNLKQLTFDNTEKKDPVWFLNNIGIAYIAIDQTAQSTADIHLITEDGSNQRRLTSDAQRELNLSIAGNGQEITYSIRPEGSPITSQQLYVIDPQSEKRRRVYPPVNIESLQCPGQLPRGSSQPVKFELSNSSTLPSGVPVILRIGSQPLPVLSDRNTNAMRVETVDVPAGENLLVEWPVHSAEGLSTYVSVLIDIGEYFPMAEQHCIIPNTYLGMPNLPYLPSVMPLTITGMLLTLPWLRHQKKRWLWGLWLAIPIIILTLIGVEAASVQAQGPASTLVVSTLALINKSID